MFKETMLFQFPEILSWEIESRIEAVSIIFEAFHQYWAYKRDQALFTMVGFFVDGNLAEDKALLLAIAKKTRSSWPKMAFYYKTFL